MALRTTGEARRLIVAISDVVINTFVKKKYEDALNDPDADHRFHRHHELGVQLGLYDEKGNQLTDVLTWGAVGEDPLRDDKLEFVRLSYWVSTEVNKWMHEIVAQSPDYKAGMLAAEKAAQRDSCC